MKKDPNPQKISRVAVGLSGGVDSSVSAALLKEAGHDVTGVFIEVWQPDFLPCSSGEDRLEAMRAAAHLGIPFETVDFSAEYKRDVVDYMIAEYAAGRTPNPDVMCNRSVKFGALWAWARERGFDAVATGHYAQIQESEDGFELHAGADAAKDQSYFLWTLTQEDLSHILFPVGGMQKSDVRMLAQKFGLPNAARKDSQGLCFMGKLDVKDFLKHFIDAVPGAVVDENGNHIGTHDGAMLYTLGERHGFLIEAASPHETPYFVVAKDVAKNTLTVSRNPLAANTAHTAAPLLSMNWINGAPEEGKHYASRLRYRQPLAACVVKNNVVAFDAPQAVLPSGQSLVVYDGARVVGGGVLS